MGDKEKSPRAKYPRGFPFFCCAPGASPLEQNTQQHATSETTPNSCDATHTSAAVGVPSYPTRLTVLAGPRHTKVELHGRLTGVDGQPRTATRTKPETELERVRELTREVSEPGFRVTAYAYRSRGKERIKVEVRSGLTQGKHTWKRVKTLDTHEQALEYINDQKVEVEEGGLNRAS